MTYNAVAGSLHGRCSDVNAPRIP